MLPEDEPGRKRDVQAGILGIYCVNVILSALCSMRVSSKREMEEEPPGFRGGSSSADEVGAWYFHTRILLLQAVRSALALLGRLFRTTPTGPVGLWRSTTPVRQTLAPDRS